MSKLIRKPATAKNDYSDRLKAYFDFHLEGLSVIEDGGEIQVQIVYRDFKHIDTVRRELAEMMPEVEFVKVKRNFSPDAMMYALRCMIDDDECFEEPKIYVQQYDGSIIPTTLREIACTALRQVELDEDDDIRYDDYERTVRDDRTLFGNSQD